MKKILLLIYCLTFLSCFNETDELLEKTNPFDPNYEGNFVELVEANKIELSSNRCKIEMTLKVDSVSYERMFAFEDDLELENIFLIIPTLDRIALSSIDLDESIAFETTRYFSDCSEEFCFEFYYQNALRGSTGGQFEIFYNTNFKQVICY